MKKYFKLVPAALALMAMASCSNDLFTNDAPTAQAIQQGDLVVENETLEWDADKASTRSYLSGDLKVRMYTTADAIKAFDDELNKYDIYAFSWNDPSAETAGVFRRHNTATNLDGEPRWAIYPDVDGQEGHWSYNKETNNTLVTLTSNLQPLYEPDGTYQKSDTKFENPLYKDVLPRWGEVTTTEGGAALNTSLKYLTGVLRLQLNGAPQYANAATVQVIDGTTPLKINGNFTTTLAINDVMQTAEFKAEAAVLAGEDMITVGIPYSQDLQGVDAMKSVVFIPLPTTDHSVNIEVKYYKATLNIDGSINYTTLVPGNLLKTETFDNKTIKRAKVYGHTTALNFATDATNASGVSDAIELEEVAKDKDLILTTNKAITITATDNIIYIPNKDCQSITVDLSAGIANATTSPLIVKYKDVEGEGKYKNPVMIKTGATIAGNIDVQLDETPFILAQQNGNLFTTATIDASALTLVGAVANTTTAYTEGTGLVLKDNVKTLNVATDASITAVSVATNYPKLETINVTGNGAVVGAIAATGIATEINAEGTASLGGAVTTKGDINISEKATWAGALTSSDGNIDIDMAYTAATTNAQNVEATKGNVSINSEDFVLTVTGTVTAGKDVALSGKTAATTGLITAGQDFSVIEESNAKDVNVKRDATINITGEAVAVSGNLTYTGDGKLNLFNGYVNTVIDGGNAVGLYHGETAGFTAIGKLTSTGTFASMNTSIWNGKQIGTTFTGTYALETTTISVWTASQLGYQLTTAAGFTLQSDIDLDNKDWKGINATAPYTITGNNHTISNINIVNSAATITEAGFIANNTNTTTIDHLSFDGVKTTINQLSSTLVGVGAVIGKAAGATLTNVDVKLATGYFGSMNGNKNVTVSEIGGVIGEASAAVTLTGVAVDATNAILAGHHSMGGFIGKATNNVTINNYGYVDPTSGDWTEKASSVTGLTKMQVTLLDLGANGNDPNQGKTGYYIGSADLSKTISISGAADVNPTFTVGGLVDLSKAFSVSGTPAQMNLYSAGAQSLIGQSGFAATGTPSINGATYGVHVTSLTTTPNNVLYKVTVTPFQ